MKILVTDGAERAALAATRSLGRGAQLHVVASTPTSLAGVSRWCATQHSVRDPLRDPTGFVSDVSSLASKLGIDVVLPVSDASCHALLPERARLGHTRLAAPSAASYTRLSDKAQISALARAEDLELPEGREAHGTEQALQVAVRLGWPVVLKPAHSVLAQRDGGQRKTGVVQVRGADELREAWPRVCGDGKGLVQRIVPGWGEGLFLLRWQGRTRAVFAHRRLREKPPSGGTSVLRESISADPQRLRRVEAILDAVGFDGVAMAEFKTDGRKTWLMEFNARLWGSLQLAIDAGVDFSSTPFWGCRPRRPRSIRWACARAGSWGISTTRSRWRAARRRRMAVAGSRLRSVSCCAPPVRTAAGRCCGERIPGPSFPSLVRGGVGEATL
jgi:predicted ATP-grasp superfamily ATP-dependent carboligase